MKNPRGNSPQTKTPILEEKSILHSHVAGVQPENGEDQPAPPPRSELKPGGSRNKKKPTAARVKEEKYQPKGKRRRTRVEEAIQRTEAQFWEALEDGTGPMATLNPNLQLVKVNRAFCDLLGYTNQELQGRTIKKITYPDDVEQLVDLTTRLFKNELPSFQIENRYLTKSHINIWCKVAATVVRDRKGKPTSIFVSIENITERKRKDDLQALQRLTLEMVAVGAHQSDVLNELCSQVKTMLSPCTCTVMLLDEQTGCLNLAAPIDLPQGLCSALDGLVPGEFAGSCGTAVYTGKPVIVTDTEADPRWADLRDFAREFGIRACWSIPFFFQGGQVVGTFAISHSQPHEATPFDLHVLETVSYVGGIAIQRTRAQEDLRASEDRFRNLYESAPLAYFSASIDGQIQMVNACGVELLGYTKKDLIGRSVMDLYALTPHGEGKAKHLHEQLISGRDIIGEELEMERADGSRLWVRLNVKLIFNAQGKPVERRGVVEDINERKRAEIALGESKKVYEELVNSVKGIVWEADLRTFQFTLVSQEAERLLGYPCTRWIEEPTFWHDHIHPEDRSWVIEYCIQHSAENDFHEFEYRMIAANGDVVWLRDLVTVVWDKGERTKLQGVMVDISELKQAEDSLAGQKSILEHIALSTPLSEILNSLCQMIEAQSDGLFCSILLLEGDQLWYGAAPSLPNSFTKKLDGMTIGPAVGSCGTAAFRKEPVTVSDIATDPLWEKARHLAMRHGLQACWSTPILSSEGSVLGTFAMYYTQPRYPHPKERELVKVSTNLAGIAIERRRSEEALQARAHQQALVAELGQSALTGLDLPALMHNAVSLIAKTLDVEYCKVLDLLPDGEELILRSGFGCPADAVNPVTVGAGLDSQAGYTLVSDEPVVVEDLRTETRFSGTTFLHQLGLISGISVIISGKPHHFGVLGVHTTRLRTFTRDDIHFVQSVANVLALAIERKQAEDTLNLRSQLASFDARISHILTQSEDLKQILHDCTEIMVNDLDAAFARIWTLNEQDQILELQASSGLYTHLDGPHSHIPVGQLKIGMIASERRPHLTNTLIGDPRVPEQEWANREGMVAFAGYPLLDDGQVLGVMAMFARHPLTEFTLQMLESVAGRIAISIERKRTEKALKAQRMFLRQVIDINPNFVFSKNREGRFILVNQAVADAYGTTVENLLGKTDADFNPNIKEVEFFRRMDLRVMDSKQEQFIAEEVITDAGGKLHWLQTVKRPLIGDDGVANHILGVATDITARKQAEESLRKSEEHLRFVTDNSPVGIAHFDQEQRYKFVNRHYAEMFGLQASDIVGKFSRDFLDKNTYAQASPYMEAVLAGQYTEYDLLMLPAIPNGPCTVHVSYAPERDASGHVVGFVASLTDITKRKHTEDALRERTERYELIAAGAYDAIWDWDVSNHRVYFSPRWKNLHGVAPDEVIDRVEELSANIHHEDVPRVMAAMQAHFEGKTEFFEEEYRIHCKDDSWKWVLGRGLGRRDATGRVVRMAGSESDITERKKTQLTIKESEQRFRDLAEHIQEVFWMMDQKLTRILYVNPIIEKVWGCSTESIYADPLTRVEAIVEEDKERVLALFTPIQLQRGEFDIEYRICRPDGSVRWIHDRAFPIHNIQGEVERFAGIAVDITQRKKVEERLRDSQERYRLVMESSPSGMAVVDTNGIITLVNQLTESIFGYSQGELIGQPIEQLIPERVRPQHLDHHASYSTKPFSLPMGSGMELFGLRKDGSEFPVEIGLNPIQFPEGEYILASMVDITDRKHTQNQLRELSRQLRQSEEMERKKISRELHDEFGQLLTALKMDLGWLDVELDQPQPINKTQFSEKFMAMGAVLNQAIDSVRRVTTLLRPATLDTLGFLPALDWLAKDFQERTGIVCEVSVDSDVQPLVLDDERANALFRIAQEFLTNVMRHAHASEVHVTIGVKENTIVLVMTDNGIGISPQRIDSSTTLGVLGMKERTVMLGGQFTIAGKPGEGTQVTVALPLDEKDMKGLL